MLDATRRSVLFSLAALVPLLTLGLRSAGRSANDRGRFSPDHALAFLDETDPRRRQHDGDAEVALNLSEDRTTVTLTADFDDPSALQEADLVTVQLVPKQLEEEER